MKNDNTEDKALNKTDVSNSILTFDNIHEIGFEYNYFEGFTYQHKLGYSISVYDINTVFYRGSKYKVNTFHEFIDLIKSTHICK